MVRESDGLYLYDGTSINNVEKSVDFAIDLIGGNYSFDTNQLSLYGSNGYRYVDLSTGKAVYCVVSSYENSENSYFDGNGNAIDFDVWKEQDWKFDGRIPNPENREEALATYGMWCEYISVEREVEPRKVCYYSADMAFIEYLSECGLKPLTDSAETIVESPENVIDDSEWREAYKRAYARDNDGNQYCFIGQSNTGVPYLAKAWGGLDYYNGSEVISLCYSQNIEYNPVTNKVSEFSHTSLPNGGGDNFYLIDLNIGEVELSCSEVTEDWDTGIVKYYGSDSEISEEEYIRISDEMSKRFGDDGNIIETWYDSVELAYRAYDIKRGSTSASASASATNASGSADTALATDDSASDNNINIDVESEVKQIRQWYSDTQNGLDNLMYSQYGDGIEYYFELGYAVKGIISSGYDGWDYTRQYFYKDQKLYFAFVFKGSEEYRVYFKDGKVIRYIDNNSTVFDYGNIGDGEQLGQKIIAESDKLYPEFNCGA